MDSFGTPVETRMTCPVVLYSGCMWKEYSGSIDPSSSVGVVSVTSASPVLCAHAAQASRAPRSQASERIFSNSLSETSDFFEVATFVWAKVGFPPEVKRKDRGLSGILLATRPPI